MASIFDSLRGMFADKRTDIGERFQILREAINGTMSNFHMALDHTTGKTVGLKILDTEKTAVFEARFKGLNKPSEGKIAAQLKHPRIVDTFEHGTAKDGRQYILMEFVPGLGMNVLLKQGELKLVGHHHELVREMAEALDAVHKAGFIHRDICPRNFIVAPDCKSLKLIDFGLTVPNQKEYWLPGNRTGTPLYMAPEIVRRKTTDHRVDIFSFGVTAYQLCAGEFPWPSGDTTGKGALQHDAKPPQEILELVPNLNRTLARTIMQCIQADPNARPVSFDVIVKTLKPVNSDTV
ncbi:Serine/threonine-protein kinase PK-1 [Anatilimnocola aggregata]|uniref:Serine/threonine-protein kinase PK-1 n=1 Tax=Anatilimnocola aggregata TaxID=2528021 RepID=A0A517Y7G2_9BACT|nr:serine/threonine-protein kinase [Anatilimnocola aggregata]QDU26125.1 Serine/threonine-protein kinase PK-1 [Anatilimnocola aggregata]